MLSCIYDLYHLLRSLGIRGWFLTLAINHFQVNLRQRIVQDMITIVVKSDKDNDQTIDRAEAKTLALRIRLTLQEYGVEFDSDKFLKVIGEDSSVQGVIAIVQKLLPSEKPKKDVDDYDSDEDSDEDSEDDLYDMFHMCGDNMRGSVLGAKNAMEGSGSGVSLMTCDKKKSERRKSEAIVRRASVARVPRDSPRARSKKEMSYISESEESDDDDDDDSDDSRW